MPNKPIDISGHIFGTSVAVSASPGRDKAGQILWACECECGHVFQTDVSSIRRGRFQKCPQCKDEWYLLSPYRALFYNYERGASQRGYSFDIEFDDFVRLSKQNCTYCGLEPFQVYKKDDGRRSVTYMGIDRQDNSQGYVLENVVSCCKFCNFAKSRFPLDEFLVWVEAIRKQPDLTEQKEEDKLDT